jgi:hypothetical protein
MCVKNTSDWKVTPTFFFFKLEKNSHFIFWYIQYINSQRIYRVIRKSLRDFRPLRYSSRDGNAEGERLNRGRNTPSFCTTLQVLNMSTLGVRLGRCAAEFLSSGRTYELPCILEHTKSILLCQWTQNVLIYWLSWFWQIVRVTQKSAQLWPWSTQAVAPLNNCWYVQIYSDTSANEDNSFRNHIR